MTLRGGDHELQHEESWPEGVRFLFLMNVEHRDHHGSTVAGCHDLIHLTCSRIHL